MECAKGAFRNYLCVISSQLTLIGLLGLLYLLSAMDIIPSPKELSHLISNLFLTKGLPVIAVFSLLENTVGINFYFPGAFTILAAMSMTAGNPHMAIATYFVITIPSM